jgi:hypothetical protein
MARRATLLLCVLLVLSGCSALLDADTPTPTPGVTPAPVPADAVVAPGLSPEGVVEPAVLADAHATAITDESFVLTAERTVRYTNGSLHSNLRVRVAVDADRTYLATAATDGPEAPVFLGQPPANATYWSNSSVFVRKLTRDGRTTYNDFDAPGSGAGTRSYWTDTVPFGGEGASARSFYGGLFAAVPVEVTDDPDSEAAYRLSGSGLVGNTTAFSGEVTNVSDVRLVASVTERGLVSSLSLRYAGEVDGAPVEVTRTVAYEGVGETTVERPDWFERAVGAQNQSSAGEDP